MIAFIWFSQWPKFELNDYLVYPSSISEICYLVTHKLTVHFSLYFQSGHV